MLIKPIYNKIKMWKKDSRGISYVELLIAISLISGVLLVAYAFLSFSYKSMIYTQAKYDATQDARIVMIKLGDNIRKAQTVTISGTIHNAVKVSAAGYQIDIYVDVDNDGTCELVRYKMDGDKLVMGQAKQGFTPTTWSTIIDSVHNKLLDTPEPIFTIDKAKVNINLYIMDEYENMSEPVCIKASYTVRSKGAM